MARTKRKEIVIPPEEIEKLPDHSHLGPKDIPIEKILDFKKRNLTSNQIAELLKCSGANIRKRLQRHGQVVENIGYFKDNRADIFAIHQLRALGQVAKSDIKPPKTARDLKDASQAIKNFYECERLERNLSTENVSHDGLIRSVCQVDIEIKRIEDELRRIGQSGGDGEVQVIDVT